MLFTKDTNDIIKETVMGRIHILHLDGNVQVLTEKGWVNVSDLKGETNVESVKASPYIDRLGFKGKCKASITGVKVKGMLHTWHHDNTMLLLANDSTEIVDTNPQIIFPISNFHMNTPWVLQKNENKRIKLYKSNIDLMLGVDFESGDIETQFLPVSSAGVRHKTESDLSPHEMQALEHEYYEVEFKVESPMYSTFVPMTMNNNELCLLVGV